MKYFKLAFAVAVGLSLVALASADRTTEDLNKNYRIISEAFKKRDFKTYSDFIASDYLSFDSTGHVTSRVKFLDTVKKQMMSAENVEISRVVTKVTVKRNRPTATVNGILKASMILDDGKRHLVDQKYVAENTWVWRNNRWLLFSSKILSADILLDGKKPKVEEPKRGLMGGDGGGRRKRGG